MKLRIMVQRSIPPVYPYVMKYGVACNGLILLTNRLIN